MNKVWKKAAVYFLSASLAATSLAGCSKDTSSAFDADATVMTINEEEVSAGVLKFAVHYSQAQTQEIYEYYFGDNPYSYEYSTDYTIGDMVIESCVETFHELILAKQHMEEYEVELTEDEEAAITEAATAFIEANDEETLEAMSATQEIVEEYLTLLTIQTKMEVAMVADVDTEVSDEEAAKRRVEYAYVETEDETEEETEDETEAAESETGEEAAEETEAETAVDTEEETVVDSESETALLTGNTAVKTTSADETESETETADAAEDESDAEDASEADTEEETEEETETETETEDPETVAAMAAAYDKAEQIIALVQDGMDLEEAAAEVDEDLSVTETTFGADSTAVSESLITATDDLEDDTLVDYPVEATSGYYVVRVISAFDEEATEEEKESIVEERKEEAIEALYEEWEEDSEITTDEDVYATITIDINLSLYEEEETEAETEAESETGTEEESETEPETGTEAVSETASEEESTAESETEAPVSETEAESETETETEA
ncbi:MAG: hypothetical protein LIP11_11195 [Clostridiales bacterium]|nr:hypothetical protein [Clostridiales bacterium]